MSRVVDREYFKKFFKHGTSPHVIKFFSDVWHVCHELEPEFKKLSDELENKYIFIKFDIDTDEKIADLMAPDGVPTIYLFKDGNMREINYGDDGYSYDYLKESILNETNLKKDGE